MKPWVRALVFVVLGMLTVVVCHLFPNAATNPESGMVMHLPKETAKLQGIEVPVSRLEAETLPPDTTYLKMVYFEKFLPAQVSRSRQMAVTLILAGSDRRSLHEPEVCLDGQGWDLVKRTVIPIELAQDKLEVMELELGRWARRDDGSLIKDQNGKKIRVRALYTYWWVAKEDSTPHSNERIMRTALNNMFRNVNDRWGYPSLFVPFDRRLPFDEGKEEARARTVEFIQEFAPKFQKSLGAVEPSSEQEQTVSSAE